MRKFLEGTSERRGRSGSLGEIEELSKRKRQEDLSPGAGQDNQVFKRSQKTPRSPDKKSEKEDGMEAVLRKLDILTDIQSELKELRKENQEIKKNNEELRKEVQEYQKFIQRESEETKTKIKELEQKVGKLEGEIERRDKQERRNNIIVTERGWRGSDTETERETEERMKELLTSITGGEVKIVSTRKIKTKNEKINIVEVKLNTFEDKMTIMKNKGKLRGSSTFIDSDLTIEGDEDGEYTYVGERGETVIDYVLTNEWSKEDVTKLVVGAESGSDHMPVWVEVTGGQSNRVEVASESETRREI